MRQRPPVWTAAQAAAVAALLACALSGACTSEPADSEAAFGDAVPAGDAAGDVGPGVFPPDAAPPGPGPDLPPDPGPQETAGSPDTPEDAEPEDAEVPDAGPTDAEPPDAGQPDVDGVDPDPPTFPAGACGLAIPIGCGETLAGDVDVFATGQVVDATGCNPFFYPAPELVFRFTSPGQGTVSLAVETEAALDILALAAADGGGCDEKACLGWGPDETNVEVMPGDEVYAVVDGYQGAKGAFLVSADCSELVVPPPSCAPQALVQCGDNLLVAEGGTQEIDAYGCGQSGLAGPERAFTFVAPASGNVTVALGEGDGMVFVLHGKKGCNPDLCLAAGVDGQVSFEAESGSSYELVADTVSGFAGKLSISVSCPSPAPADP